MASIHRSAQQATATVQIRDLKPQLCRAVIRTQESAQPLLFYDRTNKGDGRTKGTGVFVLLFQYDKLGFCERSLAVSYRCPDRKELMKQEVFITRSTVGMLVSNFS